MAGNASPLCRVAIVAILSIVVGSHAFGQAPRTPILIDTDIGADIDDAFAIGLAFATRDLDVRGVTTVGDDAQKKAMLMCRFLTVTGRRHTRVAVGAKPQPPRPMTDLYKYYYHPDALFNRTTQPEKQDAAGFLYALLKQQPAEVALVALGPLTNIARLIEKHPDSIAMIKRVIVMEANITHDVAAARTVFASKAPVVVISSSSCRDLRLDLSGVQKVFEPRTPLTRQIQAMYQMWDQEQPPLGETLAVAMCLNESFVDSEPRSVSVNDQGQLAESDSAPKVRVITSVNSEAFIKWYSDFMASRLPPGRRPARAEAPGRMPNRVHVAEDFETDIERFWWMSGKPEVRSLPPGSRRACRGVLTHDFDALLMPSRQMYSAVIFNPVPGPPMGKNTRLSFRYWLKGTDTIRVQIYSLSNGYHRHLVVNGLAQEKWTHVAVDLTKARRPDGTGGPLRENERIDDIQFYVDPDAEIIIDDIVLYDAAPKGETRPFPKRILFTGFFDTGKQGQHWPGDFEIVDGAGSFWKAARSIMEPETGKPRLRVGLRGYRRLGHKTKVAFRYLAKGAEAFRVRLADSKTGQSQAAQIEETTADQWTSATIQFDTRKLATIDEIHFDLPKASQLLVDDLLLFEPGEEN